MKIRAPACLGHLTNPARLPVKSGIIALVCCAFAISSRRIMPHIRVSDCVLSVDKAI
jgi:hypothetical protein